MEVELLDLTNIIRQEHPKRSAVDPDHEVLQGQEVDLEVHPAQEVDQDHLREVDLGGDQAPDQEVDHELEVEHQKTRKREEEAKKD